jgi:DNA topoisomerase IA
MLSRWQQANTSRVAGEGVITYMRTDGVQLAQEIVDGARAFVRQQFGEEYLPLQPRIYKCETECLCAVNYAAAQ